MPSRRICRSCGDGRCERRPARAGATRAAASARPIPALLAGADVLLSATQPEGSETLDKVVYEAAASGLPVLSSNVALDDFLGELPLRLRFARRDPQDLAQVLLALAAAPPELRWEVGQELRRRVESGHSVESWADAVLGELAAARPGRRPAPG